MNIQNINRLNNEYRAYIYEAELTALPGRG